MRIRSFWVGCCWMVSGVSCNHMVGRYRASIVSCLLLRDSSLHQRLAGPRIGAVRLDLLGLLVGNAHSCH